MSASATPTTAVTTVIETDFRVDPSVVSRMRRHVAGLYAELSGDEELAERTSMVVYEMVENVAKYAATEYGRLEVSLHTHGPEASVRVRTRNAASPERLAKLCRSLDAVRGHPDPTHLYDEIIARCSVVDDGESGLGIARVRAEGRMQLSYSLEGAYVTIDAEWSGRNAC